jgi:phytoene/squalene synthetase
VNQLIFNITSSVTKTASKQTYYTVRFLADRDRIDDAYRTYTYFRWVDDILDADSGSGPLPRYGEATERISFLERQKSLLESCYRGEQPRDVDLEGQNKESQHDTESKLLPNTDRAGRPPVLADEEGWLVATVVGLDIP